MYEEPVTPDEDLRSRPLGELLGRLGRELGVLIRQEADLAKAEMREKARDAAPGLAMFGIAAAVALLAAGALTATAILALALALPAWAAALIVAIVLAIAGVVLVMEGRERIRRALPPVPTETIETVKEDIAWAKEAKDRTRSEMTSR